jgi:hypothetical protein
VALDRAIRLATKRSLPLDRARLLAERDRIYEAVMTHGWDAQRRTFVQYFGTDALDAANLIMPLVFFISPNDPRMIGTLNRTIAELVSDSLVHRHAANLRERVRSQAPLQRIAALQCYDPAGGRNSQIRRLPGHASLSGPFKSPPSVDGSG